MPKMPRFLRPSKVRLTHLWGEDEAGEPITTVYDIDFVSIDVDYAIKQESKGIHSEDSALLVIDMTDLVVDGVKVVGLELATNDIITYKETEYTVTSISNVDDVATGKLSFIEVHLHG